MKIEKILKVWRLFNTVFFIFVVLLIIINYQTLELYFHGAIAPMWIKPPFVLWVANGLIVIGLGSTIGYLLVDYLLLDGEDHS